MEPGAAQARAAPTSQAEAPPLVPGESIATTEAVAAAAAAVASPTRSRPSDESSISSQPCGSAFLRRLHTDPNATHVTLPLFTSELSVPSKQPSPVPSGAASAAGEASGVSGVDSPRITPIFSPTRIGPSPLPPDSASEQSANSTTSHFRIPLESPVSPRTVAQPLEVTASMTLATRAMGPSPPLQASAFQERIDRNDAPVISAAVAAAGNIADRAASFGPETYTHELNMETANGGVTTWDDFAVAYCNGRFDPSRIPNPPDLDTNMPWTRSARLKVALPNSAPTTVRTNRSFEDFSQAGSVLPPSASDDTSVVGSPTRQRMFELESLPHRRKRPSKIQLPTYKLAAATVRLASSNLPDSVFAPLAVPSPERELLDPLASLITPSTEASGYIWSRSKSSVLPAGTPTHETLPSHQGSPATTPAPLDMDAPTTMASSDEAFAAACCGASFVASDFTASKRGAPRHNIPAASAPLPRRVEHPAEDYFGGAAAASDDIEEPTSPIPVPSPTAYPLVHHPHELRPFFEKYGFLPAPMPPREAERRKALYNFNILHTAGDVNFDRIVHLAKLVFNTRLVFLSLIDSDVQWYKSQTGFGGTQSPRVTGFCGHTLLVDSDEPFVVLDTQQDWRFAKNPHVVGEPRMRFYAGTPLRTSDGLNLGSLCLVDDKPRREFTPRSRHILKEFAAIVMRELELWRDKLQLRTRDKIQTSMENFTRECLEIDDRLSSTTFETASRMGQVYQRAAKLVHQTLDLDGCAILDISQFERVEVDLPDGSKKVVYHANPYQESGSVLKRLQTFGPVAAFPVLASTPHEVKTRELTSLEHERMSLFLGDQRDGRIFENIAPSWIRYIFPPTLKYGMVVPVIGIDGQPFALICAHTHDRSKQFLEGYELQFLRAIGVIILSAVLRRRMILADRSKSVLISSVSHELRTPLHGILAATELLSESALDTNQAAFLSTVKTCGMQLIETVNHVLDFTKLSSEKGNARRATQLTRVDLADIVEQTVESCFVGQRTRFMQTDTGDQLGSFYSPTAPMHDPYDQRVPVRSHLSSLESVVDVDLRPQGWNVMVDSGSMRRIVMNLYGNSLKFTEEGFVQVSLRELPHAPDAKRIPVELTVVDTGKGIGKSFLKDQLFEPFTQENPLQAGTGLGLAIVNSIVRSDAVHGTVDVWSAERVGTQIKVSFEVELADDPEDARNVPEHMLGVGYKVAFLGFDGEKQRGLALVREVVTSYAMFMGLEIVSKAEDADLLIVNEFIKRETETNFRNTALILVATFKKSDPQLLSTMGRTAYTGLVYKPIGPSKVLKEFKSAINWLKHPSRVNSGLSALSSSMWHLQIDSDDSSQGRTPPDRRSAAASAVDLSEPRDVDHANILHRRRSDERELDHTQNRPPLAPRGLTYHAVPTVTSLADQSPTSEASSPASAGSGSGISTISLADGGAMLKASARPEVSGRRRPARVLVIEDNVINRRVLTAFLKKRGFDYAEAVNGAAGVALFDETPPNSWDVILMDITMPIMNGYDATRSIRRIESSRRRAAADQFAQAVKVAGGSGAGSNSHDTTMHMRAQMLGAASKIFALTGLATDDDKRQAFDSGVDGYLVKPVSLASLDLLFSKIGF